MPVGPTDDILKISKSKFDHLSWDVEIVSERSVEEPKLGIIESFKSVAIVNHDLIFLLRIEVKHNQKIN